MKIKVKSSAISEIAYDGMTLYITFVSNRTYAYYDVAEGIVKSLINAESIGRYFNQKIKGIYEAIDVTNRLIEIN